MMAAFIAIMMIMTVVPVLGFIPLGFMNATIIHIPVIVGSILLGPKKGAVLGFFFGLTSMWKNTALMPNLTSFVFTPFLTMPNGESGGIRSVIICMVPRILIGVVAYYVYRGVSKIWKKRKKLALAAAGVAGDIHRQPLVETFVPPEQVICGHFKKIRHPLQHLHRRHNIVVLPVADALFSNAQSSGQLYLVQFSGTPQML